MENIIQKIYFAAGCFWGAEKYFKLIDGVISTTVGYANGNTKDPKYEEVYTDTTGFAECVEVCYDSSQISLSFLVELYFKAIDPTSLNRQGADIGTRYRTGIYYINNDDLQPIAEVYKDVQANYLNPLEVEVLPLKNFYKAEEYHQAYLEKNPTGYCHITPDLFEFAKRANKQSR